MVADFTGSSLRMAVQKKTMWSRKSQGFRGLPERPPASSPLVKQLRIFQHLHHF
jgi:hypothetical protein